MQSCMLSKAPLADWKDRSIYWGDSRWISRTTCVPSASSPQLFGWSQNRITASRPPWAVQTNLPSISRVPTRTHRYGGKSPSYCGMVIAEQRPVLSLSFELGNRVSGSNIRGFPLHLPAARIVSAPGRAGRGGGSGRCGIMSSAGDGRALVTGWRSGRRAPVVKPTQPRWCPRSSALPNCASPADPTHGRPTGAADHPVIANSSRASFLVFASDTSIRTFIPKAIR